MNLITLIESIPPAFYGVLIGSLLTIIGVTLTNISNTKRLRIQHEHEVALRNKERDLNMRREVYMDAMEAISAGITAISRFSELSETPEALMQSYSSLSSKLGKVTIVGQNETIEALANFQLDVNGAFLRMSAKREKFDAILRHSQAIEAEIEKLKERLTQMTTQFTQAKVNQEFDLTQRYQAEIDALQNDLTDLQKQEEDIGNQLMPTVANLVQTSMAEVSGLNKLLVPLISLMRTELELPFNSEHFARILQKGNDELEAYMASFFNEYEQGSYEEQVIG
jgi:archaellum component FlaC